ncbi:hypothetical protein HYV85_05850, partial [Candidatus Woesearchaeota archaeon]|nr:hypothetical protein [Candidatus Woesearchaeota archaeon]
KRYTKRVVSEEVNTLLEGRFGVLDDSIGTGSSTQRGKPESALPKLLPDELVKSLDPKNPAYSMLMEAVKSYNGERR